MDEAGTGIKLRLRDMQTRTRAPARRRVVVALSFAGIAGPIGFSATVIVQGLLQPDYSHVALPISALAAWPSGWIQSVSFFVFGLLMIGYAIGLHLGIGRGQESVVGPAILVLSGIGLEVAGAFPWRYIDGSYIVPGGHIVGAFMSFLGAGIGLIVMSRRMAADSRWRSVAAYALATGVAIVILFMAQGILVRPEDAPLHAWAGIAQRVTVAVWFTCTIVLALRLLNVARKTETQPE
jgi:hypothetical protein